MAIYCQATGKNFPGKKTADRGGETHGFIDAGSEVAARVEDTAVMDIFHRGKLGANLGGNFLQRGGMTDEVEDSCGDCGRCRIRSSDDAVGRSVLFSEKLGKMEPSWGALTGGSTRPTAPEC